jgi:Na+-driven multidrug efflux pump
MDWVPIVFVIFKVLVLGTGMFLAVKWHYDQGKKEKGKRAAQRSLGIVAIVFLLSILGMAFVTYEIIHMVGLNLTY